MLSEYDNDLADPPTQHLFVCHRSAPERAETWAVEIPAGKLQPIDVGAYISIDWTPRQIVGSGRRWGLLQAVGSLTELTDGTERTWVALMIDGVDRQIDPDSFVWIGWNPDGPDHMQRGGFVR